MTQLHPNTLARLAAWRPDLVDDCCGLRPDVLRQLTLVQAYACAQLGLDPGTACTVYAGVCREPLAFDSVELEGDVEDSGVTHMWTGVRLGAREHCVIHLWETIGGERGALLEERHGPVLMDSMRSAQHARLAKELAAVLTGEIHFPEMD